MGKTLDEIYELPASEIETWRAYFSIFPFSQDRADQRTAVIASTVANTSGNLKKPVDLEFFMPDYLGDRNPVEKSLAMQAEDDKEFGDRLKVIQQAIGAGQ